MSVIGIGPQRYHASTGTWPKPSRMLGEPLRVESPGENLGLLLLTVKHVENLEPVEEGVLEVRELLQEHDGAGLTH